MNSIGTRFSLAVGAFAVLFSGIILYRAWSSTRAHTEELIATEARLAQAFDVAIREYAAEAIRPEMEKRIAKDDFVLEAMSTSYIARKVFEKVRKDFPDHVIRFSSDNPRNPDNKAAPEEMKLIEWFRDHPQAERWTGRLTLGDEEYVAHVSGMRIESSCLRCHGQPEDSPKSLLERYGNAGGFYRKVGDVAGLDVVAIPMQKVNAAIASDAKKNLLATGLWLIVLFGSILLMFRWLVSRRLAAITSHFRQVARQVEDGPVTVAMPRGSDEISVLAQSYNSMAEKLQALRESLEQRVRQRTMELEREQETLKHLLQSSDHERQLIAYEIHDGLAQDLAGAVMQFETYNFLRKQNPDRAEETYDAAVKSLRQGLAEARRLISGLRPPALDELGVVSAIAHLVHEYEGRHEAMEIAFHDDVQFSRLAPVLENAVYRIVQECLANAVKHSRSKKVQVDLTQEGDRVHIAIQDWGIGFAPDCVADRCFGLKGLRERTRLLGGTTRIDSTPGEGTRITVDLPIVPASAAPEDR